MDLHASAHPVVDRADTHCPPPAMGWPCEDEPGAQLEAEIRELWAHISAATYRFLTRVAEFDEQQGWARHGCRDCAHWLNWQCGIGTAAAREKVRVARALKALPAVSAAFAAGTISYSKVRALSRVATPATEKDFLNVALHGTAAHMEKLVRLYRRVERLEEAREAFEARQRRYLRYHYDDDGSLIIQARLPAEIGALFKKAIELAEDRLFTEQRQADGAAAEKAGDVSAESPGSVSAESSGNFPPEGAEAVSAETTAETTRGVSAETSRPADSRSEGDRIARRWLEDGSLAPECRAEEDEIEHFAGRRADALGYVLEHFLAHPPDRSASAAASDRYCVTVHIDQTLLTARAEPNAARPQRCDIEGMPRLAVETARRLACEAPVVGLLEGEAREPLNVGRRMRSVPSAIDRAVKARDGGCTFPGCWGTFTHTHHIRHWADGGETSLTNLTCLCRFHHALVHEGGFTVERSADGRLVFSRPDGSRIEQAGTLRAVADGGLETLNAVQGLEIDASTCRSRWTGEGLDYDWAIMALMHNRDLARQAH